jgi:hypothetical protein
MATRHSDEPSIIPFVEGTFHYQTLLRLNKELRFRRPELEVQRFYL